MGGEGGAGGNPTTGGSGTGGSVPCMGGGPVVVETGSDTQFLLRGVVLTPTGPLTGEVLIENELITCVAASCTNEAAGATIIKTNGIIAPGMIDTHNHILFDIFDEDDWSPAKVYDDHDQWPQEDDYGAMVDAKQYLNGEFGSPVSLGCEMLKYGEMKALVAGTTAVQGSPGAQNKACYGSIARTIDMTPNDLPDDKIQTATIFPSTTSANGVCANFADGDTDAYVIHIGEGVNARALDEFADLGTVTSTPNCLYSSKTTIVHGTALGDPELSIMGANGMHLSWSPKSNIFLYGGGTDFSKTTKIPLALSKGINVSISPDWSLGGSVNMLDELRYADEVDNMAFGNIFTPQVLFDMATINPAKALGLEMVLGSIEVGKRADIVVYLGDTTNPYDAILAATPKEVALVMIDGRALYGDSGIVDIGPANSICEELDLCCRPKFACIAETGQNPADKLDQTFADFSAILETAILQYDALPVTDIDFAPIAPLTSCSN
jgi:5-methylthioadenosine/S-adenosylhomocysteine deaminase